MDGTEFEPDFTVDEYLAFTEAQRAAKTLDQVLDAQKRFVETVLQRALPPGAVLNVRFRRRELSEAVAAIIEADMDLEHEVPLEKRS